MKFLALDTSSPTTAMAVMEDAAAVAELSLRAEKKHGERLIPALEFLLKQARITLAELSAYAVGRGPGSFTGLRTGLAFIKGLALAEPRPVIGVSTLETLASAVAFHHGLILPVTDARKGEVFAALFDADGRGRLRRRGDDRAVVPEVLAELVREPVLVLGDALFRYRERIEMTLGKNARVAPEPLWYPRASWLGALAFVRLQSGEADAVDSLMPIYIRSTDDELQLGRRRPG